MVATANVRPTFKVSVVVAWSNKVEVALIKLNLPLAVKIDSPLKVAPVFTVKLSILVVVALMVLALKSLEKIP